MAIAQWPDDSCCVPPSTARSDSSSFNTAIIVFNAPVLTLAPRGRLWNNTCWIIVWKSSPPQGRIEVAEHGITRRSLRALHARRLWSGKMAADACACMSHGSSALESLCRSLDVRVYFSERYFGSDVYIALCLAAFSVKPKRSRAQDMSDDACSRVEML